MLTLAHPRARTYSRHWLYEGANRGRGTLEQLDMDNTATDMEDAMRPCCKDTCLTPRRLVEVIYKLSREGQVGVC